MKKQTIHFFCTLNNEEMKTLTTIVSETVAADQPLPTVKRNFGAADLWNIQRNRRTFVQRRMTF